MSADILLSRLDGVKRTGPGRYLARCPAHEDRRASLSIRETEDEKTLIHCFAGCCVHEIVSAAGLELSDLFPQRPADPAHVGKSECRPFPAADILRAISFEVLIVALCAGRMLAGEAPRVEDRDRLHLAHSRLQAALAAGGIHE